MRSSLILWTVIWYVQWNYWRWDSIFFLKKKNTKFLLILFFNTPTFGISGGDCKWGSAYRVLCITSLAEQAVLFFFRSTIMKLSQQKKVTYCSESKTRGHLCTYKSNTTEAKAQRSKQSLQVSFCRFWCGRKLTSLNELWGFGYVLCSEGLSAVRVYRFLQQKVLDISYFILYCLRHYYCRNTYISLSWWKQASLLLSFTFS